MEEEMEMVRDTPTSTVSASAHASSSSSAASSSLYSSIASMFASSSSIEDQGEDKSGWCECLPGMCRPVYLKNTDLKSLVSAAKWGYLRLSDELIDELIEKKTDLQISFHESVLNRDPKNSSDLVLKALHLEDLLPFQSHIQDAFKPSDNQSDSSTVIVTQTFVSFMTPFLFSDCCRDLGMSEMSGGYSMSHEDMTNKMKKLGVDANTLAPGSSAGARKSTSAGKTSGSYYSFTIKVEGVREFPDTRKVKIMQSLYSFQPGAITPLLERLEALNRCVVALRIGREDPPEYDTVRKVSFSLCETGHAMKDHELNLSFARGGAQSGASHSDAHQHTYNLVWNNPCDFTKMSDHQYQNAYFIREIPVLKSIDIFKDLSVRLGSMVAEGPTFSDFLRNTLGNLTSWFETLSPNENATAVMFGPREGGKSSLAVTLQSLIAFVVRGEPFDGSDHAFQKVVMRPLNTKEHKDEGATDVDAKDHVCLTLLLGGKHHVQLIDTGGDTKAEFTKADFHAKCHVSILVEPLEEFMNDGKIRTPEDMITRFGNSASYTRLFGEGVTDLISVLKKTKILVLTKPDGALDLGNRGNNVVQNVGYIAHCKAREFKEKVAELQETLRHISGNASLRVMPMTLILTWKHDDGVTLPATMNMHAYNQLTKELGTNFILELFQVMGELAQ